MKTMDHNSSKVRAVLIAAGAVVEDIGSIDHAPGTGRHFEISVHWRVVWPDGTSQELLERNPAIDEVATFVNSKQGISILHLKDGTVVA